MTKRDFIFIKQFFTNKFMSYFNDQIYYIYLEYFGVQGNPDSGTKPSSNVKSLLLFGPAITFS